MDGFQIASCHLAVGLDSELPRIRALDYIILTQKGSSNVSYSLKELYGMVSGE